MPMRLLAQNREVFANSAPIHMARGNLVHTIICYRRRDAPVRNMDFQPVSDLLLRDLLFPSSRAPRVKRKESSRDFARSAVGV
jgi:hypothetical protein